MKSIRSTASALVRELGARVRVAPSQLFLASECTWLVVVDDVLLRLDTGREARLEGTADDWTDAARLERLAAAARELCEQAEAPVALLLPSSQFVYSHYSVQLGAEHVANRELILSAIALQKDLLLPAMEEDFAVTAGAGRAAGVAFWLPQATLQNAENAFREAGLTLAALLPRALAIAPPDAAAADYVVVDEDAASCSIMKVEGRVATRMLSALKQEFDNAEVAAAWAEQAGPLLEESPVRMAGSDDWRALRGVAAPLIDYLFYSRAFLDRVDENNERRKAWAVGAAAMAAALLLALPLVYQWVDAIRLESIRDTVRREARVAAAYQNEILGMESEWGVVYEYPEADIPAILTTLNAMIRNSLTSFTLDRSTVEIQGFTADPEQLAKLLVAEPMFERVEQTRSISGTNSGSGDRFGFKMTLADSGYEQYIAKYNFE